MRRLLPFLALLTATGAASAADMAVKNPLNGPYPTTRCGFYYGINAEGGAGIVPNAPAGTTMIAGDIGVLAGYACPIGATPWFLENIVDFQNLNAGNNGFSLSGPIHVEQRVGVQTPLLQLLPNIGFNVGTQLGTPQPTSAVLPPGATLNGTVQNYIYGALNEDDISSSQVGLGAARKWLVSPEVGTGLLIPFKTAGGTPIVADSYAGYEVQSNSMCIGSGMCPKLGNRYKVGLSFKY
jgi:hypothetical protein